MKIWTEGNSDIRIPFLLLATKALRDLLGRKQGEWSNSDPLVGSCGVEAIVKGEDVAAVGQTRARAIFGPTPTNTFLSRYIVRPNKREQKGSSASPSWRPILR